jgi:hypothetical protein
MNANVINNYYIINYILKRFIEGNKVNSGKIKAGLTAVGSFFVNSPVAFCTQSIAATNKSRINSKSLAVQEVRMTNVSGKK